MVLFKNLSWIILCHESFCARKYGTPPSRWFRDFWWCTSYCTLDSLSRTPLRRSGESAFTTISVTVLFLDSGVFDCRTLWSAHFTGAIEYSYIGVEGTIFQYFARGALLFYFSGWYRTKNKPSHLSHYVLSTCRSLAAVSISAHHYRETHACTRDRW